MEDNTQDSDIPTTEKLEFLLPAEQIEETETVNVTEETEVPEDGTEVADTSMDTETDELGTETEHESTETEFAEMEPTELSEDILVEGTSAFGELFSNELTTEVNEQQETNGYNIFSVEINDDFAVVNYETLTDATLVIGIYDETGVQLLASGSTTVSADDNDVMVEITDGSIPAYFYMRAFLIHSTTRQPLCNAYESPIYTQEMQEFLTKTTEDFAAERVLNLDGDTTNNFAVFGEEVLLLKENPGYNDVVTADDINHVYVIENADADIMSLQTGDIFAYVYGSGETLIVKAASVDTDGTTVTVIGADTSMQEVFDYVKIDAEATAADAVVDESACSEGVVLQGQVDAEEEIMPYALEGGGNYEKAMAYQLMEHKGDDGEGQSGKVSGTLEFKVKTSVKLYVSSSYFYLEFKINYAVTLGVTVSGSIKDVMKLGKWTIAPISVVHITFVPSFVFETSISGTFDGKLEGTIGQSVASDGSGRNLTSFPKLKMEMKIEGTTFVGLSMEPEVKVLSDKIAEAKITAKVGAEAKTEKQESQWNGDTGNTEHPYEWCLSGKINGKLDVAAETKFVNHWKYTQKIANISIKLADFYYCWYPNEFGWGICPRWKYRMTVLVTDNDDNGKPLPGATISGVDVPNGTVTDEDGKAELWLAKKESTLTVTKDGYRKKEKTVLPREGGEQATVCLEKENTGDSDDENNGAPDSGEAGETEGKVKKVSLGYYHSAAIMENGDLYLWGENNDGQLGNGTRTDSLVPVRIMEHVKEVCLGSSHSAAITENGDLYLWGWNKYGQLGNGTKTDSLVPVQIMEHVKEVCLGGSHSAAITENGTLYMWGRNDYGQFGDGTTADSLVPKKIMTDVKKVAMGANSSLILKKDGDLYYVGDYSEHVNGTVGSLVPIKVMEGVKEIEACEFLYMAITENGDLYLWGDSWGCGLGNGMTDSEQPVKIMEGVKKASTCGFSQAAVTENGDLYLWGWNYCGQLGNGTTVDSATPIKIMGQVKGVSFGLDFCAAITESGDLYLWGNNYDGQLGNGTTTDSLVPVRINLSLYLTSQSYAAAANTRAAEEPEALQFADAASNWNGTGFTNLVPNETYNYYVMRDADAGEPFANGNLLCIGQAVSGADGTMYPQFALRESCEDADYFAVPMHAVDISGATVTLPKLSYNGCQQYAVPTVVVNGSPIVMGTDFDVRGDYSVREVGEYTLIITGTGIYTGKVNVPYTVDACEHRYDAGVVTTEPTETTEGVMTYTCILCGDKKTEAIPKKEPDYTAGTVTANPDVMPESQSVSDEIKPGAQTPGTIAGIMRSFGSKRLETNYNIKTVKLSNTRYIYNGREKKPGVIVIDDRGRRLKENTDYTVNYPSGAKEVGRYTVTVSLKGKYSGTVNRSFVIKPKGTSMFKTDVFSDGFSLEWNKQEIQTSGYQIQYSTSKTFMGDITKTVLLENNGVLSRTITGLDADTKYYVRIRTYKKVTVNGKQAILYSGWSVVKTIKTEE